MILDVVLVGLFDVFVGIDSWVFGEVLLVSFQVICECMQVEVQVKVEVVVGEGCVYLVENVKCEGVIVLFLGLQFEVLSIGEGVKFFCEDIVCIYYYGILIDGIVFDSFYQCGQLVEFLVGGVIVGWVEVL